MGRLLVTMASLCVLFSQAIAQTPDTDLPRFDVEGSCAKAALPGPAFDRTVRLTNCIESEQRAYDSLKSTWHQIDSKNKTSCLNNSRGAAHQYSTLELCASAYLIRQRDEERAKRPPPAFRY